MYELRLATRDDLPVLTALIAASVRGLSHEFYDASQIEASLVHVFGVDTQLIADRTYYVVDAGGEIVAAGGWSGRRTLFGGDQLKSGSDTPLDPAREPARIRAFFVHPSHARRGLARRLYERCAADAAAAGFHSLELAATLSGVALYAALGFSGDEEIHIPMPGHKKLTCIRMSRPLTPADST